MSLETEDARNSSVTLDNLVLPPNWYRLFVRTNNQPAFVSARARFCEDRRPEMRMRLEPTGRSRFGRTRRSHQTRHFQKTLKIAEPLTSLSVSVAGDHTEIAHVEVRALNRLQIIGFLAVKMARYAISNRAQISWKSAWTHFRTALGPRANLVFRDRYDEPESDDRRTYDRWRALHERPESAGIAVASLAAATTRRTLTIGLLVARGLDSDEALSAAARSVIGSNLAFQLASADAPLTRAAEQGVWDFVLPFDHPGVFAHGAIERLVWALIQQDGAAVFADSDELEPNGSRRAPRLKPPWDGELLRSANYIRAPLMLRWRPELAAVLASPGAAQRPGYALALDAVTREPREKLLRVNEILFHESRPADLGAALIEFGILDSHLRASAWPIDAALVERGVFRVNWRLPDPPPPVSIIIPTRNNQDVLKRCVDSILTRTRGLVPEIVIADNGSDKPGAMRYLSELARSGVAKVVDCAGPFNFSKINNAARGAATGEILVFLNDDTKVLSDDWLVELVSLASRPDVGAVGALLLYPDGRVQHAGVLLGVGGFADHAFRYFPGDAPGYLDLLCCRREATAVTGACLAVKAEDFDRIGGFDESLKVACNDIDLCLKLRAGGLINIWTPWAKLEHYESLSRGADVTTAALDRQASELRLMAERWGILLDRDPLYHPGLDERAPNYGLSI